MFDALGEATLITYYPPSFIMATVFIFFIGYFYGYAVSFIFGIKKTLTVGFFVVILSTILVLFSSVGFILTTPCSALDNSLLCSDYINIINRVSVITIILLSHLLMNIALGHIGVLCGIINFYPSEWFLKKYYKFNSLKKSAEELDQLTANEKQITMGSQSMSDISLKK
jgi:hypothetical protein